MNGLTDDEARRLKRTLLRKGSELADKLSALLAGQKVKLDDLIAPKPGETPIERLRRYLDLVDRKIKAIDAGTYGACETCGAPLGFVALDQMPWAEVCRACAAGPA